MPGTLSINTSTGCFVHEGSVVNDSATYSYVATFKTPDTDVSAIIGAICGDAIGGDFGASILIEEGICVIRSYNNIILGTLSPNTMYQVIVTYNAETEEISGYLNGEFKGSDTYTLPSGSTVFGVGNLAIEGFPNINLNFYSVRVFNYILSQAEITEFWNSGFPEQYYLQAVYKVQTPSNNYTSNFSTTVDGWVANSAFGGTITHGDNSIIITMPTHARTKAQLYKGIVPVTTALCRYFVKVVTNINSGITKLDALPWTGGAGVHLTPTDSNNRTEWTGVYDYWAKPFTYSYLSPEAEEGTQFTIYSIEFKSIGCTGEWLAQHYTSGNWLDTISGKVLTAVGTPTVNPAPDDVANRTLAVNCIQGYFTSTSSQLLTPGTRTYVATFKTPATLSKTTGFIFAQDANSGMRLHATSGNILQGWIGSNGFTYNGGVLAPNTMYQVVLSYDKSTGDLRGAINGVVTTTNNYPNPTDTPTKFSVGNRIGAEANLQYDLYDFRVFNKALTSTEITTLWNNGHPDRFRLGNDYNSWGCIAEYLAFDYTTGDWVDSSQNVNNLTPSGSPEVIPIEYQKKTIPWTTGAGSIYLYTEEWEGNQFIWVESDPNRTLANRTQTITLTNSYDKSVNINVTQIREGVGNMSIGGTFVIG